MKKLWIVGLLAVAGISQAVVIDDFSTGDTSYSTSALGSNVFVRTGSMTSGERDVEANILSNPFGQFLDFYVNTAAPGMNIVSQGFGLRATIKLQYDQVGDEVAGPGTLNNGGLGIPLIGGSDNIIRVNFLGNDLDVQVTGVLRSTGTTLASVTSTKLAGGAGALDLTFAGGVLQQADSITIEFAPMASGDFGLESIETVPEPATLAMVGLGALGLMRRRRKV